MHHDGERVRVVFDEPVPSVAPGQFVVLYDGDVVRGCAEITATRRAGASGGPGAGAVRA